MEQYTCPPGLDCSYESACPAPVTACPPGFFCGPLLAAANNAGLNWPAVRKAYWVAGGVKDTTAEPPPVVTSVCPAGFYCPNATTILACPAGYYCPEQTVVPAKCEPLAVCPAQSAFPVDFAAILLAAILTALFAGASRLQNSRQKAQEHASRALKADRSQSAQPTVGSVSRQTGRGVAVSLQGLDVTADDGRVHVLRGVTAQIPEGRVTGVFGPSASGKSTLLEAIRSGGARLDAGNVIATLGGRTIRSGAEMASRIALVPQEDISVDRTLTVRELLLFSARSRRPQLSKSEAEAVVTGVLTELGLLATADTVIGGGENAAANISGGQLKRVNIAMELVALARPGAAICLDEFTAGLDSAVALDLVQTVLQPLAREGVTVICVMQQPRPEIFQQLHHVLLLQKGSLVYEGPPSGVAPYFAELGFVQLAETSDADFAVDVLNGIGKHQAPKGVEVDLAAAWAKRSAGAFSISKEAALATAALPAEPAPTVTASSWLSSLLTTCRLIWLHAARAMTVRLRNTQQLWIYSLLHVLNAVALSSGFSILIQKTWRSVMVPPAAGPLVGYCPTALGSYCNEHNVQDIGFNQMLFFCAAAIGIGASLAPIPLFGQQVPIIRREAASGLHPMAYMAGRLASDALFTIWYATIFTGCWMLFAHPGPWYGWLGVVVPTAFATAGLGVFAVALTGGRTLPAAVMSIILIIFFAVFSGVEPTLASVKGLPVVNWLWYISFSTWAAEGTYWVFVQGAIAATSGDLNPPAPGSITDRAITGATYYGYDITQGQGRSIGILIAIGIAWRLIAALVMWARAPMPAVVVQRTAKPTEPVLVEMTARRAAPQGPGLAVRSLAVMAILGLATAQAPASSGCSSAIVSFAASSSSPWCATPLSQALTNASVVNACTASPVSGVTCQNPLTLMALPAPQQLSPVPLGQASICPLCNVTANAPINSTFSVMGPCGNLLSAAMSAAVGGVASTPAYTAIGQACSSSNDQALLASLVYQGSVVCGASTPAGASTTIIPGLGTFVTGAMDLRSLTQCGTCGVMPCTSSPGQAMYCPGNVPAAMCPPGYYCPVPSQRVLCPEGYFCPSGSMAPIKCGTLSSGSCPAGSERDIIWVPLLIAVLIIAIVAGIRKSAALRRVMGLPRPEPLAGDKQAAAADGYVVSARSRADPVAGLAVRFDNVRMITGATTRLAGVSGEIRPGRFTCMVGGSGAGKTSLMNALLGREQITSGDISFTQPAAGGAGGAAPVTKDLLRRLIGFVPQVDVLLREMTVEQALLHSARLRMPATTTAAEAQERVDSCLRLLSLEHLRHTVIGGASDSGAAVGSIASGCRSFFDSAFGWLFCSRDGSKRRGLGRSSAGGMGGGDRKLVSLAVELVARPSLLALDEPTSSVDASTAMRLCELVQELCHTTGMTALAVLHQPRGEIFRLIDDLIVLVPGGRIAYQGSAARALVYFARLGFPCPPKANRTDFLLDVVAGTIPRAAEVSGKETNFAELWQQLGPAFSQEPELSAHAKLSPDVEAGQAGAANTAPHLDVTAPSPAYATAVPANGQHSSFFRQVFLYAKRAFLQRLKGSSLSSLLAHLLGGIIIGIVTCGGPLLVLPLPLQYRNSCPPGAEQLCSRWLRVMVEPATFYVTMTLGAISLSVATGVFGREKQVLHREAHTGCLRPAAYYLGKILADIPFFALAAFCFMAPMIAIAPWRAPPGEFFVLCWAIALIGQSLGSALSLLMADVDAATLVGVIAAIILNLFGGFVPMLGGAWAYTFWTARGITAAELDLGAQVGALFNKLVASLHKDPAFWTDIGFLVLIITLTHLCGYALLRIEIYRKVTRAASHSSGNGCGCRRKSAVSAQETAASSTPQH